MAHLAVCASAQYGLAALASGARIARFVSIAGWFHDLAGLGTFYGGEAGIAERLDAASRAARTLETSGTTEMVPPTGPATCRRRCLRARLLATQAVVRSRRGATRWPPVVDLLVPVRRPAGADQVATPALFIHSDGCVFPDNVRSVHDRLRGPKRLVWSDGTQTDYYDQPAQVRTAVAATDAFLKEGAGMTGPPVALVTGANRGLGLECARQLLTHGFTVLLGARDAGRGAAAAKPLPARGCGL